MSGYDLTVLALRSAALLVLFWCALFVTDAFWMVQAFSTNGVPDLRGIAVGMVIGAALKLALALTLWCLAPRIAAGATSEPERETILDPLAIGALALRVVGILLLDAALSHIPKLTRVPFTPTAVAEDWTDTAPWVSFTLLVGFGMTAILFAGSLATRIFRSVATPKTPASLLAQAVGFSLLGLWILAAATPALAETLFGALASAGNDDDFFGLDSSPAEPRFWIEPALRVVLGCALFFGGTTLAHTWHRLRTAGLHGQH